MNSRDRIVKEEKDKRQKDGNFLSTLRTMKCLVEEDNYDGLTKSYWFNVVGSTYRINAYMFHSDESCDLYRVKYLARDPVRIMGPREYLGSLVTFEKFFEGIPEEAKAEIIFHLDIFP